MIKNIVVTGGSGTLGQALQKVMPDAYYLKSSDYDLTKEEGVKKLYDDFNPDVVIHAAALVGGIQDNIIRPEQFFSDNILMDTLMLRFAMANALEQFIGILSTCAYPDIATSYPMTEDMLHHGPPAPTNFSYGYAKRAMAVHIDAANQQYGTKFNYVIPCNLYSGKTVQDPQKAHFLDTLLEKIAHAVKSGHDSISLMGTGVARRQFMLVDDLAQVLKMMVEQGVSDSFNVCPADNYSIREITQIALEACNATHLKVTWDKTKPDGQLNKQASNEKFMSLFPGFRFTNLFDGIREVYLKKFQ